uniref:Ovule protein n=1 Tax=Panagrolaimus davidi TaxID=227884 RepID=A0A914PVM4_9BILA
MLDLIYPEFFRCFKFSNNCSYYHHQNYLFKIQSIHSPVWELENSEELSGKLWKNKSEGLVHAVILVIGFQLELY